MSENSVKISEREESCGTRGKDKEMLTGCVYKRRDGLEVWAVMKE